MKVKEFLKEYSHGPFPIEDVVFLCQKISDDDELVHLTCAYVNASNKFQKKLKDIGFVFG